MDQTAKRTHGCWGSESWWVWNGKRKIPVFSQNWESSSFHGGSAHSRDPSLVTGARAMAQEGDALTSAGGLVPGLDSLSHPPSQANERQLRLSFPHGPCFWPCLQRLQKSPVELAIPCLDLIFGLL